MRKKTIAICKGVHCDSGWNLSHLALWNVKLGNVVPEIWMNIKGWCFYPQLGAFLGLFFCNGVVNGPKLSTEAKSPCSSLQGLETVLEGSLTLLQPINSQSLVQFVNLGYGKRFLNNLASETCLKAACQNSCFWHSIFQLITQSWLNSWPKVNMSQMPENFHLVW